MNARQKFGKKLSQKLGWLSATVVVTAALASSISMTAASCSQTPANVPVRSLVRSGRMDTLCLQVCEVGAGAGATCTPIPAVPVTADHCAPVPSGVDPTIVPYHLVALVTQTLRGELAVIDLTLGRVVDTSRALPGINFLPVGENPTDVVVTPDVQKVFVTAAETNKPAIYMLPSTQLLGDSEILAEPTQAAQQLQLPTWPACALPQAPGRMVVVPTTQISADGGTTTQGYEIVVSMPGNGVDEAALVGLIDVAAFDSIAPGSLQACPIKAAIQLAEAPNALPSSWMPGPSWGLGLPYLDAGIDLFALSEPQLPKPWCSPHGGEGGAPVNPNDPSCLQISDGGVLAQQPSAAYQLPLSSCPQLAHAPGVSPITPDASALAITPGGKTHGAQMATDGRYVWIGDDVMPFIHVIDTGVAGTLTEIAPLVATSMVDPSRVVTTADIAISPVTRDFKRYLYAVDATTGTMLVYDVTDPANGPRLPLTRPNPELDPLQPPDRVSLGVPVATITFARHDFPIPSSTSGPTQTGLLCNPNPNAGDINNSTGDAGVEYRANGPISVPLGPKRLRGVFGFATLTNGQVIAIDVDDWDAPCRRPLQLTQAARTGSLAAPEPSPTSNADWDPYHVPVAGDDAGIISTDGGTQWVSTESMWPIIEPNRPRSINLVYDDLTGTNGLHDPNVTSTPQLLVNLAPVSIAGSPYTLMEAAFPEFYPIGCVTAGNCPILPSPQITPNVFMSHDRPDVHVDQTWNIVYEGILPGFDGVAAAISTDDNYATMKMSMPTAFFCERGVEDQRLGLQRFAAMTLEDNATPKNDGQSYVPLNFDQRVADYVQITDDIIGSPDGGPNSPTVPIPNDAYWGEDNSCWNTVGDGSLASTGGASDTVRAARQNACIAKFGGHGADQNPQRDFPIIAAYDDHVVLGRFDYLNANRPTNGRIVAPPETSTVHEDFELAQCCFANQAHFHVRTGTEWVALGTVSGYLHHVVPDPTTNACVQSCDPRFVLLNSRVPELAIKTPTSTPTAPNRNSPFAMRNPAFSFYMAAPIVTGDATSTSYSTMQRDNEWQFATRGQYGIDGVSLTTSNSSVLPQSSLFVAPLGSIAVVDGSANGVFIIDLNTLAISDGSPFY